MFGKAEGNIEGLGETKLTVSRGASHEVFCYTSQLKNRTNNMQVYLLGEGWYTNLLWFQCAQPDHVRVKS